jgi:antitoxin component YwqK of YwqJK toxin-antitoxin module
MQIEDGKETVSSHVSWSYEYDEEGNIISFLQTDHVEGSEVSGFYEYEPDETGSAVKRTSLVNGEVREICRTEYDESGRKIREVSEQADGTIFSDREYVYNEEGKLIQETTYDTEALKNGERKISVETYYVYDSQGRRKARYSGLRDEGDSMTSQFYVYQSEEP